MHQVVIKKAHLHHEGTDWNALGLLVTLLHVVALHFRSVTREDSELVEFIAAQKRIPVLQVGP
jgi:hypothetical protein